MLERVNKGKLWLYSSPLWKDNCSEKRLKLTMERSYPKTFQFSMFLFFFVKFSTDFDDWNLVKNQQREMLVVI